ncbi:pentatricopeptide repeat-containing protein At2g29760, chloroplastic-like [Cornus florida]|uniref:pentatricopeptide repeat-containing protein At2g29760, chloroplastic-like n=1 Tax=Cornus florida TaxID=4283 RepID=UPI00289CEF30|nr:pentatricopeptide repeat-containing protein At2g29760, chloroplastic-like [Cornus florida]
MSSATLTKLLKLSRPHLFLTHNCTNMKEVMKFHAHFITNGLSNDTLFLSTVLSFTALSPAGNLAYAHLVFNHLDAPNLFMFNTMIRGYASSCDPIQAISLYIRLFRSGLFPNNYTFPFVIKASSHITDSTCGHAIHGSVIKFGHLLDLHISNSLLHMYASFGFSKEIVKLFDEMPEPDVVSWNVVIDDYAQCGCLGEVLYAFDRMWNSGVEPNSVTLLGLLSACSKMGNLHIGRLIHLYIIKNDIHVGENLGNGLLDMYAKFGDIDSAEKLFKRMPVKTVFSWTSMIDCFIQKGELESASVIFNQMPEKDTTSWNVMLNGFMVAGNMNSAEEIFKAIPDRDLVSWNSMIVGCAQNKKYVKALEFFREMLFSGVKPDRITLVSVFSLCWFTGALELGESAHACVEKQNIKGEEVEVALLDMYSKCGAPEKALRVFNGILRKSVLAWSAMIVGLAMNGLANEALHFFHQMQIAGTKPNEVTFIGVLCACSYAGLVEEGKWFFNAMDQIYGIKPRAEHFGCMVDVLGRAGLLKEAEIFIQNLPVKVDASVWGALLGACRMHGEVQMGEKVARILKEMDATHSGQYVLLSNIYAAENRWLDAEKVRKEMKASGVQKKPGFSLIELKGDMHQFLAGNTYAGNRNKYAMEVEITERI